MDTPSKWIDAAAVQVIREHAAAAELEGCLQPVQLQLITDRKWFKLFVPSEYGGLQMTLSEVIKLQEALAYADGSLGWTVTLCSGAAWFAGFLNDNVLQEFALPANACWAGSGMPTGTAQHTKKGYLIHGEWKYASGALHATVFTTNCKMLDETGNAILDKSGNAVIHPFVFRKDEVQLNLNWKSGGMIATGSHGFSIHQLEVPANRCFQIDPVAAIQAGLAYQYPFLQLAEATLAVNISGIAVHFMEEAKVIIKKRIKSGQIPAHAAASVKSLLAHREKAIHNDRMMLHESVASSWMELEANGKIVAHSLEQVSMASRVLALEARLACEALYVHCGIEASVRDTVLNRAWRDLHTASQHGLLLYAR